MKNKKDKYDTQARTLCPWFHVGDYCPHCDGIAAALRKESEGGKVISRQCSKVRKGRTKPSHADCSMLDCSCACHA